MFLDLRCHGTTTTQTSHRNYNIVGSNTTNASCVDISNEIEMQCNGMLINICPDQKLYGQDNQSLYINLLPLNGWLLSLVIRPAATFQFEKGGWLANLSEGKRLLFLLIICQRTLLMKYFIIQSNLD